MISFYDIFAYLLSRSAVNFSSHDLAVTVDVVALRGKMLVSAAYVVSIRLLGVGSQLAAEIFVGGVDYKLIRSVGVVFKAVIYVVIVYRRARAEGYLAVEIGEHIYAVVMVMLGYLHI